LIPYANFLRENTEDVAKLGFYIKITYATAGIVKYSCEFIRLAAWMTFPSPIAGIFKY